MEFIAGIVKTDPQLAEDLIRLLNEIELARHEHRAAQGLT